MGETQLNKFPFPDEFEEPFFDRYRLGEEEKDKAHHAHAENDNLLYTGGGTVSWSAATDTLTLGADVKVTGHTNGPFFAVIPAQAIEIEDGEAVFFVMPRFLKVDQNVTLLRSTRIFKAGVRLHDLRVFAIRVGDTLLFGNGASLLNGQSGVIFGGGLSSAASITEIQVGPDGGIVVTDGTGPVVTIEAKFAGSGGNFGVADSVARSDHSHAGVTHTHEPQLKIEPGAGATSLNLNADGQITAKTLIFAAIYRNGSRLTEGDDVVIDLGLQQATLTFTTVATDRFTVDRITT